MNKEKIKEFTNKYKTAIEVAAGIGISAISVVAGFKLCEYVKFKDKVFVVKNGAIAHALDHVKQTYPKHFALLDGYIPEGLKKEDLGQFGEKMQPYLGEDDPVFTHFICFGPEYKG